MLSQWLVFKIEYYQNFQNQSFVSLIFSIFKIICNEIDVLSIKISDVIDSIHLSVLLKIFVFQRALMKWGRLSLCA